MRHEHIITELSRGLNRMRILFFDVETVTVEETESRCYQAFRLACVRLEVYYPGDGWKTTYKGSFTDEQTFLGWVDGLHRVKSILYIISANIWFDLRVSGLFMHLMKGEWCVKIFHSKGYTNILKLRKDEYNITCLNMQQFIPVSVKAMGEIVGLEKLDTEYDTEDMTELLTYCERDVDIIVEAFRLWIDYIKVNDLGKFSFTMAGQAFTAFRHRFMSKDIYIHANDLITEYERKTYYGGRVELFRHGVFDGHVVYKLDINSMYPGIMKTSNMPVKWVGTKYAPGKISLMYSLHRYLCYAHVALDTPEPAYPVKHKKKLIFPTGRFTTYLAPAELQYAYDNGHIESVEYLITYKPAIIFDDYIDYFYKLRLKYKAEGNKVFDFMTKRMMNSLYGKFGQKIDSMLFEEEVDEERYECLSVIDKDTGEWTKELTIGHSRKVYKEAAEEGYNSFVAIAAQVTSLARIQLWKLIKKCGIENMYYCDTDSLFVNQAGFMALSDDIDNKALGMLGVEDVTNHLELYGPKDYVFGSEKVIKGIRKDAKITFDGGYSQISFPGFKGDLKHGLDKPYGIVKVTKHLKREYTKGICNQDGTVTPLALTTF